MGYFMGVSTRLMGALIMTHSDDNGLVLPPALAPIEVVMVPIYKTGEQYDVLCKKLHETAAELRKAGLSVKVDDDDSQKPGWKFHEYELKGVPVRMVLGPNDLEKNQFEVARRDTMAKEFMPMDNIAENIKKLLADIQKNLFDKAATLRSQRTYKVDTWDEFVDVIENKSGFALAHWDGSAETEEKIKELTKATIRCIPMDAVEEEGKDVLTGKPSSRRVVFAKAY